MFKQLLQDSLAVLRRPTLETFQKVKGDSWQWGFVYVAIASVLRVLITLVSYVLATPLRAQLFSALTRGFAANGVTPQLAFWQNPVFRLAVVSFLIPLLWIFIPYWLGRAFGGPKSFGKFTYNSSLYIAPVSILNTLLSVRALYLVLFIALNGFSAYLVHINLQATMGMSRGKSALLVLIPILLALLAGCGFVIWIGYSVMQGG